MSDRRIALLDLFAGVSGDMLLGALLDAGTDADFVRSQLETLNLPGFDLEITRQVKKGLSCTRVQVRVEEEHHPHRKLPDIEAIVRGGSLPEPVVDKSLEAFGRIARAEAKIHGKSVEEIHFHEVGALDAVVDVAGTFLAVHQLEIDRFYCSSVAIGTGTVSSRHGILPVPCPATVEILEDFPVEPSGVPQEMVTPTGAALLKTLAGQPGFPGRMRFESTGYGAGSRDIPGRANVARVLVGREGQPGGHLVSMVETNIDDMNPEIYSYVLDCLFKAGALDAFLVPVIGKKNRPAVQITAVCDGERESSVAEVLLRETTSLGVRTHKCLRSCLKRRQETVETRWGEVRVKVGQAGSRAKAAPEYEDCRRIAREQGIPLLEVYEEVRRVYGG